MNETDIDRAVAAHEHYRHHLEKGIALGTLLAPPEELRSEHRCALGRWLYDGERSPEDRAHPAFRSICERHARFHEAAARVAELARGGRTGEALRMMTGRGRFGRASKRLLEGLLAWKRELKAQRLRAQYPAPPPTRG